MPPPPPPPCPRILCDVHALASSSDTGVLWRLEETGRQLDANVVRLAAHSHIDTHAEPDLDVFLMVVEGDGTLSTEGEPLPLLPGTLLWLPRGSQRSLTAGAQGLAYLTAHQRRPGLQIRQPTT